MNDKVVNVLYEVISLFGMGCSDLCTIFSEWCVYFFCKGWYN